MWSSAALLVVGIEFWIEEIEMFEVGQKVWDVVRGEGVVARIISSQVYPVIVKFSCGGNRGYTMSGEYHEDHVNPSLYPYPVEVIKKVTKPSINWEHVRGEYKFLVQDEDGNSWLCCEKPELDVDGWDVTQGECSTVYSYASYTPGTCDWKDSLVARPEGV